MYTITWNIDGKTYECVTGNIDTTFQICWNIIKGLQKRVSNIKEYLEYAGTPWIRIWGNGGFYHPEDLHTHLLPDKDPHVLIFDVIWFK